MHRQNHGRAIAERKYRSTDSDQLIIRTTVTKPITDTDTFSIATRNDDDDNDNDAVNANDNSTPSLPYTSSIAPAA